MILPKDSPAVATYTEIIVQREPSVDWIDRDDNIQPELVSEGYALLTSTDLVRYAVNIPGDEDDLWTEAVHTDFRNVINDLGSLPLLINRNGRVTGRMGSQEEGGRTYVAFQQLTPWQTQHVLDFAAGKEDKLRLQAPSLSERLSKTFDGFNVNEFYHRFNQHNL